MSANYCRAHVTEVSDPGPCYKALPCEDHSTATVCLWCGIGVRVGLNFCTQRHAASFAERIVELGFPVPHRKMSYCETRAGECLHLPASPLHQ